MTIPQRIREAQFMMPTNDEWHPSFDGGFCEVRAFVFKPHKGVSYSKIVVSGDDDYSLELELSGTRMECIDFFDYWTNTLSKMPIISQKQLKEFGFEQL